MSSKTAILFPGLDALFVTKVLKQWVEVPAVQIKLKEASSLLSDMTGKEENLLGFVKDNRRLHIVDFDRTLIVLTTLQVAIAEQLTPITKWDLVQGCSHGDIARNVICEVLSFKNAIEILWVFAQLRKTCPPGYTASVRSTDLAKLTKSQLQWLDDSGASLSSWSESHGTIGGETSFIKRLSQEAFEHQLKIKPILSYPVHSEAMRPMVDQLLDYKEQWTFSKPKYPIFSSLWLRYIDSGTELFEEGIAGATSPIKWLETFKVLNEQEAVDTFINVGPSNTLTGWLLDSDEFQNTKVLEAWDLLHGHS